MRRMPQSLLKRIQYRPASPPDSSLGPDSAPNPTQTPVFQALQPVAEDASEA